MPWTLTHDGTTQTLAEWGILNARLQLNGWTPGTFTFDRDGADFDSDAVFDLDDTITLKLDGVIQFTGFISQTPAHAEGSDEGRSYEAQDALGDMNRRVYGQTWQRLDAGVITDGVNARAVLFDDDGDTQSVALTIQAVIAAAVAAGVSIQFGTAANLTVSPRKVDVKSLTMLEVLRACCVFSPDVVPQMDYTTTPPTISFIRRADATAHSLPVIDAADGFEIRPLQEQQIEGVYLVYESRGTLDGESYLKLNYDVYPAETLQTDPRVLFATMKLQGASNNNNPQQKTTQDITTRAIDTEDLDWWELHFPALAGRNEAATLTEVTIMDDTGSTTTANKELLKGVIYPWMGGTTEEITITGLFNGVINGQVVLNQLLSVKLVSTTLSTGTFTNRTGAAANEDTPDEAVPYGLAQFLYDSLNPVQWQGRRKLTEAEITTTVKPGDVLNFTGTDQTAWSTARAQVQTVEIDIDRAQTTLIFGRAEVLGPQDFIELIHLWRTLMDGNSSGQKATGAQDGTTLAQDGPTWTPRTSATAGPLAEVYPFKITRVGTTGNLFRVEAGTYDGVALAAVTVDIGATRPRYVYVQAEWTVTAWQSRFAASIARTGAPSIASSTTSTDTTVELPEGVTTAKTLIGIIDASNVVSQFASDNILPVWKDDGSLGAVAALQSA